MDSNSHPARFADRADAGRALALRLRDYAGRADVLVVGLPRGGVPVAAEVARSLHAPLDVLLVRKLGAPSREEFAMGAIATGGLVEWNDEVLEQLRVPEWVMRDVVRRERAELERREHAYRRGRAALAARGRTVIVVDDGLATGATMHAAVSALRRQSPARIVVAVPVASRWACDELATYADACVCVEQPDPLRAVGLWYTDFGQTTDAEVIACLDRCAEEQARAAAAVEH
jgi:predicted phosphoribosyltransferase